WRMPPESWCGNSLSRRVGSGMPTRSSRWAASLRAASPFMPRWRWRISVIWAPIGPTGLRDYSGSWQGSGIAPTPRCRPSCRGLALGDVEGDTVDRDRVLAALGRERDAEFVD